MMLRSLIRVVAFVFAIVVLPHLGCMRPSSETASKQTKKVVATTGMIADLARSIAAEDLEIVQLLGDGVDPHLYKPTRDDIQQVLSADLVLFNGLHLEGKMGELLEQAESEGIALAVGSKLSPDELFAGNGESAHPDPHVWMDVTLWTKATTAIEDQFCSQFPEHAERFRTRAAELKAKLNELHEYGLKAMSAIPKSQRLLVTSHDAFRYFGRAYRIEVQAVQGISTESEAGLQRINELVDLIVTRKIPAVFIESSVPRDSIDALLQGARSRGHEVKIGGELFSDAMGATGTYEGTYIGMLDHNFTTVATSLGANLPAKGFQGKLKTSEKR